MNVNGKEVDALSRRLQRFEELKRIFGGFAQDALRFNNTARLPGFQIHPLQESGLAFQVCCLGRCFEYCLRSVTNGRAVVKVFEIDMLAPSDRMLILSFGFDFTGEVDTLTYEGLSGAPVITDGYGSFAAVFGSLKKALEL